MSWKEKWRTERDSNPRYGCPYTRVPGVRLQPLGHLSVASVTRLSGAQYTHGAIKCKHLNKFFSVPRRCGLSRVRGSDELQKTAVTCHAPGNAWTEKIFPVVAVPRRFVCSWRLVGRMHGRAESASVGFEGLETSRRQGHGMAQSLCGKITSLGVRRCDRPGR